MKFLYLLAISLAVIFSLKAEAHDVNDTDCVQYKFEMLCVMIGGQIAQDGDCVVPFQEDNTTKGTRL